MRAPRLLTAGTAAASLLLLTACEQPTPIVSVVSGGKTVHSEATSWCFEGQEPSAEPGGESGCSIDEGLAPELLRVQPGDQVGIDVSRELSDSAWVVVLRPQVGSDGQQAQEQASPVQDEHYFAFAPQFDGGVPIEMQVRSLASADAGAAVTGVWRFVLAPR